MKSFHFSNCIKYGSTAAVIAFVLTALLILSVSSPNPIWGKNWFIRPLLVTPFVASFGGMLVYLINRLDKNNLYLKIIYLFLSAIVFLFFL